VWTVAVSSQEATCRQLQFSSGVYPMHESQTPENWKEYARAWVDDHGLERNLVFVTEGPSSRHPEANHRMEIIDLGC
jgi:pyruvate kinase